MHELELNLRIDESLSLHSLRQEDSKDLFQLIDSNRQYLREFLGWLDFNTTESDTQSFIAQRCELMEKADALTLAIRFEERLVGLVGFQDRDHINRSIVLGYWLDERHQGQGIMSKSVRSLMDYAFYALGVHRIEIRCAIENERSQAIPMRLGFQKEGLIRDAIWHYGDYLDAYVYGFIYPESGRILETDRMVLRKLNKSDVDNLQLIFSDPEAMRYYPGTKSKEETEIWIQKQLDRYENDGVGLWACHLKETGEFVGQCGLITWDNVEGRKEVEIGYLFVKKHWKKGLATEAAKACKIYALDQLDLKRVISLIRPENTLSRAVAERVGMSVEKEIEFFAFRTFVYSLEKNPD